MNEEEQLRMERDYVANKYGPHAIYWMERVAGMPTEQVTAIYLQMKEDETKPKPPPKPSEPDPQEKLF